MEYYLVQLDMSWYSTTQTQLNKRVWATRKRLRVTLRVLASHSRVFYATHVSVKDVNCASCGSELACASQSKVERVSQPASASQTPSVSKRMSANKIAGASE